MAITKESIHVYTSFGGDIDGWVRAGGADRFPGCSQEDWDTIDRVVHDLFLVQQGHASDSFRAKVVIEIKAVTTDKESRDLLAEIAAGIKRREGENRNA